MSHTATTWAYRQEITSSGAKFVLVALADFADEAGSCYPGQKRLAEMTGQSVSSVGRHLKALEKMGLVSRERRSTDGGFRTSDRYVLPVNLPSGQDAYKADRQAPTGQTEGFLPVNLTEEPSVEPPVILKTSFVRAFDEFWSLYPKKVGKQKAQPKFIAHAKKVGADTIINGLRAHLPGWQTCERRFIPNPTTWLERGSWDDEIEQPRRERGWWE